jgi:hypothetical protein
MYLFSILLSSFAKLILHIHYIACKLYGFYNYTEVDEIYALIWIYISSFKIKIPVIVLIL